MNKIQSYPDGASLSRQFAPDLIHSDAHAQQKVGKSRYAIHEPNAGGSGKKPPVYKFYSGLGDSEPENNKKYGGHTSPEPQYDHNAPLNNTSGIGKKPTKEKMAQNAQMKIWDDKKSNSIPKASGSKPNEPKPNKHTSFPSNPEKMPSKKEKYDPPTKKDKK